LGNNLTFWANYPPYWAKTGTLNLIGNILVIIDLIGNFSFFFADWILYIYVFLFGAYIDRGPKARALPALPKGRV
jgi:hypothetical protein